ncbi:MAG TPA: hypothetical protein VFW19_12505 [Allosphingosinicella sp.]|nr:hypothetical protein [Allosphingosinicella sp.]
MLEISVEALRNPRIRSFILQAQTKIAARLFGRLESAALRSGIDREELIARAATLSALGQGLALQTALQAAPVSERTCAVFKRTAKAVLEGR